MCEEEEMRRTIIIVSFDVYFHINNIINSFYLQRKKYWSLLSSGRQLGDRLYITSYSYIFLSDEIPFLKFCDHTFYIYFSWIFLFWNFVLGRKAKISFNIIQSIIQYERYHINARKKNEEGHFYDILKVVLEISNFS